MDIPDDFPSRILLLLSVQRKVKINSDEQHAILTHELLSPLRLTVGFLDIYCELQKSSISV